MGIDWSKAESKPDAAVKVEGRFLLDLRAKVNDLEKQLTETKSKLAKTQETLSATTDELQQAKSTLEVTTNELSTTKQTFDQVKAAGAKAVEVAEAKISVLSEENDGLKNNLADLTANIKALEAKLENAEKTVADMGSESGDKISGLSSELGQVKGKIAELESSLESSKVKVADLEGKLSAASKKASDLEGQLKASNDKVSSLDKKVAESANINKELADLKTKLSAAEKDKSKQSAEIQELNSKVDGLNGMLNQKEAQVQELTANVGAKDQDLQAKSKRLEEVEAELKELKPPEIGAGGFAAEERVTCPMCGAHGQQIKQVEDRSKVLSYVGHIPMYAKKKICKKCGYEF